MQVQAAPSPRPLDDVNGTWEINSPKTVAPFSAVCYLTALWMMRMHWGDSPVGLIQSDVGGTPIEAWTSAEALKLCPSNATLDRGRYFDDEEAGYVLLLVPAVCCCSNLTAPGLHFEKAQLGCKL